MAATARVCRTQHVTYAPSITVCLPSAAALRHTSLGAATFDCTYYGYCCAREVTLIVIVTCCCFNDLLITVYGHVVDAILYGNYCPLTQFLNLVTRKDNCRFLAT